MVETTLNYLAPMSQRPEYWLVEPPEGTPWRNTRGDRRTVQVHDARQIDPAPTLDREGFDLVHHETKTANLYDADEVRKTYYPEVQALVKTATGASRVLVFDHNVRNAEKSAAGEDGAQKPVTFVHCDYTEKSGPQRVRDLLPEEAETLIQSRFAVINVWKPISGPVQESPLAFQDARTVADEDVLPTDLRYRERSGEVYSYTYNPRHRWYYYPQMRADEVLLLKCYDSDVARARFPAHTAIEDPSSPGDAPTRESIEVRTLAFYGGDA